MGNGEPSSVNNKVSDWNKSPKGSEVEYIIKFVCKYK